MKRENNKRTRAEEQDSIIRIAKTLSMMSKAHYTLCNYELGDEMKEMGESLIASVDGLLRIESEELNEMYKLSQESSGNMLRACLSVAENCNVKGK